MADENLPFGYLVSDDVLRQYTQSLTDHPMSDMNVLAHAQFMTLVRANATNSGARWVFSDFNGVPQVTFLQISGGGPNEWRIPRDVEDRLRAELQLVGDPVRFEPEWE